ncbi:MAG: SpoIIE family protein phosphatase [Acidimicrobiales bacterium]
MADLPPLPDDQTQSLLKFLYVCPIGLLSYRDDGAIEHVNPEAVNLLTPAFGMLDYQNVYAAFAHLWPELEGLAVGAPIGRLVEDHRIRSTTGPQDRWFSLSVVRVAEGSNMMVVTEVTAMVVAEERLAESLATVQAFEQDRASAASALARSRQLLADLTGELSRVASVAEVAEVVGHSCVPALGAHVGGLYLLSPDGERLLMIEGSGADELIDPWRSIPVGSGDLPVARVARTREPDLLPTAQAIAAAWPHLDAERARQGTAAWATLPLVEAEQVVGVLALAFPEPQPFDDEQRAFLALLCDRVTEAISRARLFERERLEHARWEQAERRTRSVYELTAALADAPDAESTWLTVLHEVGRAAGSVSTALFDVDHEQGLLRYKHQYGLRQSFADAWESFDLGSDLPVIEAVKTASIVVLHDRDEMRRRVGDRWRGFGGAIQAWVCLPLMGDGAVTGVICLGFDRTLDADEEIFMSLLGRQAGLALERAKLREIEHAAHERERRSRARAEILSSVTGQLSEIEGTVERAERLVRLLVPRVADFASVELPGTDHPIVAVAHRHPDLVAVLRELRERHRLAEDEACSVARAAAGERQLISVITAEIRSEFITNPETAAIFARLAPTSHIAVPLPMGHTAGALLVGLSEPDRRPYTPDDLDFIAEIGARAGVLLGNAQVMEAEHSIANRLQDALLPIRLLDHPQIVLHTTYRAGGDQLRVGGDWYDAFQLPNGLITFVVGDVVGRGIDAATFMGRLSNGLAALAPKAGSTAELLTELARFSANYAGPDFATVFVAVLDPTDGTLRYSSAGHPPGLIVLSDGTTRWLNEATGPPLFGFSTYRRTEAEAVMPPDSNLILYSDGLIERRGESIAVGLERLEQVAQQLLNPPPAARNCADLLADTMIGADNDDDAVLLCALFLAQRESNGLRAS